MMRSKCDRLSILALTIHFGLLAFTTWSYSPVIQEPCQLVAGVTAWQLGRFDIFHVNPPLVRLVAALPVVSLSPNYEAKDYDHEPVGREEYLLAKKFISENPERSRLYFFVARLACIPFSLIGGWVCWRWARTLFGPAAGLLSLSLWCFCPYVLGNASTIMTDVPAAATGATAMYMFWQWLRAPSWQKASVAGICLGLAESCKFTLLVFYPLMPILWLLYLSSNRTHTTPREMLKQAGMFVWTVVVSIYLINRVYCFEGTFSQLETFRFQSATLTGQTSSADRDTDKVNRFSGTWLGKIPVPLPANFVQGIDTQKVDFERGLSSYLRGNWSDHGWWYYYLYALAIKMPLGTWLLVAIAIGMTVMARRYSAEWREEIVVLSGFFAILSLISNQSGFSVHSRYVIPALPFLFIWTGKVAQIFQTQWETIAQKATAKLVLVALAWSTVSALSIYPYNLSYFNELTTFIPLPADTPAPPWLEKKTPRSNILSLIHSALTAGARHGARHLLDSNIDWSQDLFFLEDWQQTHPEALPMKIAYFGSYPLEETKIQYTGYPPVLPDKTQPENPDDQSHLLEANLAPPELSPGWYAVSVNELFSRSCRYKYFLNMKPQAVVGYSFYIYQVPSPSARSD